MQYKMVMSNYLRKYSWRLRRLVNRIGKWIEKQRDWDGTDRSRIGLNKEKGELRGGQTEEIGVIG